MAFEHGVLHKSSFLSVSSKAYAYDREVYAACLHLAPVHGWLIFGHVYPGFRENVSRFVCIVLVSVFLFYSLQIVCIFRHRFQKFGLILLPQHIYKLVDLLVSIRLVFRFFLLIRVLAPCRKQGGQ